MSISSTMNGVVWMNMSDVKRVAILLFSLLSPFSAIATPLETVMQQAIERAPAIHAARAELREAEEQVVEAGGVYRPTVRGTGQVGTVRNQDSTVREGSKRVIGVEVTQSLWSSGRNEADVDHAVAHAAVMEYRLQQVIGQVGFEAAEAWLQVVRASLVLDHHQAYQSNMQHQLQGLEEKSEAGMGRITDVRLVRARLQQAGAKQQKALALYYQSQQQLQKVLGEQPPHWPQRWPDGGQWKLPQERYGAEVLSLLSRYREQQAALDKARFSLKKHRSERRFSVDLKANLERGNFGSARADSESLNLLFNLPLYEGGVLRSRERSAQKRVEQEQDRLRQVEEEQLLELKNGWTGWRGDREVVSMMEQAVDAEQAAAQGIHDEVDAGIRPLMDGLKATEDLLQRQIELAEAQYDLWRSRFWLLRVNGML